MRLYYKCDRDLASPPYPPYEASPPGVRFKIFLVTSRPLDLIELTPERYDKNTSIVVMINVEIDEIVQEEDRV